MMFVTINQEKCKACGICEEVCPRHIPEVIQNGDRKITLISSQRVELCMACDHCVAVCPNDAIQVNGLGSRDYDAIKELTVDEDQLLTLMRQRRSVRRYKNKPVPLEIIEKILAAAHSAPTGTGQSSTGVIVIDNPKILANFSELVYELYEKLESGLQNPIARFFIKRSAGEKRVRTLQEFVMPGMHWYIRWYREGKSNEILRDCPTLMLFHSPLNEPVAAENCLIAAFHAILMAQVLKIGTCFNDLIPPACNRAPNIRKLLELPDDREVYASITMGYPKYKFNYIPPRNLAEVRHLN
jgi:nitroreductase/NAD-dependent dihydropyrimidine dehydrogenase PreA subunit